MKVLSKYTKVTDGETLANCIRLTAYATAVTVFLMCARKGSRKF